MNLFALPRASTPATRALSEPADAIAREESDTPTMEALQALHMEAVFRYAARRLPTREDAEDVTAETFAAAWVAYPRFRGGCGPRAWLLGIARRKVADALRRGARRRDTLPLPSDDGDALLEAFAADAPQVLAERAELRRQVRALLARLRPDQREALLLRYADELPIAEVAAIMGRSPQAANSLLQRARAALLNEARCLVEEAQR